MCKYLVTDPKTKKQRPCKFKAGPTGYCKRHLAYARKEISVDELSKRFSGLEIPSKWQDSISDTSSGNYSTHKLKKSSDEWSRLETFLGENYSENFKPSSDHVELVAAHRVQHAKLAYQHQITKQIMEADGKDVTERWGVHGVQQPHLIRLIMEQGLKGHANSMCWYGRGVYLATRVQFSTSRGFTAKFSLKQNELVPTPKGNIHHMFVCQFVTGRFTKGVKNALLPPLIHGTAERYDSTTDNEKSPVVFCLPEDAMQRIAYSIYVRVN